MVKLFVYDGTIVFSQQSNKSSRDPNTPLYEKFGQMLKSISNPESYLTRNIRDKEDSGEQAVSYAEVRVREVEALFIQQVRSLVNQYLDPGGFYRLPYNTYEEALERVMFPLLFPRPDESLTNV